MRQRQHQKDKLTQSQVSCQTAAKKMAVKFDLVRAGQNVKAEIDSFTHIMVAWHRFPSIYFFIIQLNHFQVDLSYFSAKTATLASCESNYQRCPNQQEHQIQSNTDPERRKQCRITVRVSRYRHHHYPRETCTSHHSI